MYGPSSHGSSGLLVLKSVEGIVPQLPGTVRAGEAAVLSRLPGPLRPQISRRSLQNAEFAALVAIKLSAPIISATHPIPGCSKC